MSLSTTAATSSAASNPLLAPHNNLNRKWILKRRPVGIFDPKKDAELVTIDEPSDGEAYPIEDHQVLVEPQLLSVDAFVRTMLDEISYHGSVPLGGTIPALGYGKVIKAGPKSGHKEGTTVAGMLAASDKTVIDGKMVKKMFNIPYVGKSASLGLLGLTTGLTAYAGVFYCPSKPPSKDETVVVTGAAGAVGSIAVQLCKSIGTRVVGIAGGPRKGAFLKDTLGCDAVIDYKDTKRSLAEQIKESCPDGIDFIYDNVGGSTLDELLMKINPNSRIVICGAISQYSGNLNSKTKKVAGPSNYLKLAEMGAEMKGFNVIQYITKLPFMLLGMLWLHFRGRVTVTEHVEDGLESFPYALQKLFTSQTIGKTLVRVKND